MEIFNFAINFICANTGEFKQVKKEYNANSFNEALQGIEQYAKTNRTYKKVISIVDQNGKR